jgi:hypothetical protein
LQESRWPRLLRTPKHPIVDQPGPPEQKHQPPPPPRKSSSGSGPPDEGMGGLNRRDTVGGGSGALPAALPSHIRTPSLEGPPAVRDNPAPPPQPAVSSAAAPDDVARDTVSSVGDEAPPSDRSAWLQEANLEVVDFVFALAPFVWSFARFRFEKGLTALLVPIYSQDSLDG